jgi:GlcNAc-P-P-Und epimerase
MGTVHVVGVLGGAGFIGRRLVARLVRHGYNVRVGDITAPPDAIAPYMHCDVRDRRSVGEFMVGLDAVFNLAAEHRDDIRPVERYRHVNVEGANVVCDCARASGMPRIVFTSSVAVYGLPGIPAREDTPCEPFNEYGRTKLEAEAVYRRWAAEGAAHSLAIVRPTVVFGEGNRGNVYNLAHQVATGRFVMVGAGRNRKSMAYVDNVADFLVHMLSLGVGVHEFNYADGPDLDMNELVSLMRRSLARGGGVGVRLPFRLGYAIGAACDAIARLTSAQLPISAVRVEKFCADTQVVADRAYGSGFTPCVSLHEALDQFLKHEFSGESSTLNP